LLLVLFLMWYEFQDIYRIYTVLYVYYLGLCFMWSSFTIVIYTHDSDANIDITCLP
jgi:hypothetical protein